MDLFHFLLEVNCFCIYSQNIHCQHLQHRSDSGEHEHMANDMLVRLAVAEMNKNTMQRQNNKKTMKDL